MSSTNHFKVNIIRYVIAIVLSLGGFLGLSTAVSTKAYAHRSGCHRWHSCPSDTGSYVCGDLGYSNYCGVESYQAPAPDYGAEGTENGTKHATSDTTEIANQAASTANQRGENDGVAGVAANLTPDTGYCAKEFNFPAAQQAQYVEAYKAAYTTTCRTIYAAHYSAPYSAAYAVGKAKKEQSTAAVPAKAASNQRSNSGTMWFWSLTGLAVVGIAIVRARKKTE